MTEHDPIMPPPEASKYIRTPESTMTFWRHKRRGPQYIKVGHRVFYRKSALDAFLEAGVVETEVA